MNDIPENEQPVKIKETVKIQMPDLLKQQPRCDQDKNSQQKPYKSDTPSSQHIQQDQLQEIQEQFMQQKEDHLQEQKQLNHQTILLSENESHLQMNEGNQPEILPKRQQIQKTDPELLLNQQKKNIHHHPLHQQQAEPLLQLQQQQQDDTVPEITNLPTLKEEKLGVFEHLNNIACTSIDLIISTNAFNVTLGSDEICLTDEHSFNLTYNVPLSKYMIERHFELFFMYVFFFNYY